MTLEADWIQSVNNVQEGVYTRYQTAVVKFLDPATPSGTAVGAKVNYDVYVTRLPDIKTLNDLAINRGKRPPCGDYLIKAAVPAFTAVSLLVYQRPGSAAPDTVAIKTAVAAQVNSLGFSTGRLNLSVVCAAAHRELELGGTAIITPVSMRAFIYPPDTAPYSKISLSDPNELTIPNLPARGVTQRTTVFYLPLSSISVSVAPMPGVSI
jgi:hypothetical protein